LGNIYGSKLDINNAKAAYAKAIELDADNEYAKSNFANLQ
jgi:cytochrome c-type biogenesis protein CcmH/NrfG